MVRDWDLYYSKQPFSKRDAQQAFEKKDDFDYAHYGYHGEAYVRTLAEYVLNNFSKNERLAFVHFSSNLRKNYPQYFKEDGSVVV